MNEAPQITKPTLFGHIPALDGLRAIAVLSVIGYHFEIFGLKGGFLGVDLFFVLSGFLITSLLIAESDSHGRVSLKGFWVRRFKRLMPAALVMLVAVSIWAALKADPLQLASIRGDLLGTLGYIANWRFIYSGQSYFEQFSLASPVRHAWSLAIEEQFYVLWPLIFAIVYRVRRKLSLAVMVTVVAIASAIWMAVLFDPAKISRVYYGTDTRASQLLIGVLLAIIVSTGKATMKNWIANVVNLVSLTVVIAAMFTISDQNENLYKGGLLAFAIVASIAIFSATKLESGPIHWVLCSPPVQLVGRISYGLYLWHWPVQVALTNKSTGIDDRWGLVALRLVVTFVITYTSYKLVEMPIRYSKWPGWMTWRGLVIGVGAIALVAGAIIVGTLGAKDKPAYLDANPGDVVTVTTIKPAITTTTQPGDVALGTVVLIGDSVAASLQNGFSQIASAAGINFAATTRPGCALIRGVPAEGGKPIGLGGNCEEGLNDYFTNNILSLKPKTILWMSSWEGGGRIIDGVYYEPLTPEFHEMLMREFEIVVKNLTSQGAKVAFLTYPQAIDHDNELGYYMDEAGHAKVEALNQAYFDFVKLHPNKAVVVDMASIACPNGMPCPVQLEGVDLRPRDGRHFSDEGAAYLAPKVFASLQQVLNNAFG